MAGSPFPVHMTALSGPPVGLKATEAGATLVMQRPYETTWLIAAIRKTLGSA